MSFAEIPVPEALALRELIARWGFFRPDAAPVCDAFIERLDEALWRVELATDLPPGWQRIG